MYPNYGRWGRCLAKTVKGERCKNPSTGPEHRCFVPKHKAQTMIGKGVAQQLPSPVRDSGAPMDMDLPVGDKKAMFDHIRNNRLNTNNH